MKYVDLKNALSLHMIYAGYYNAGREWCYKNVISPFTRLYLIDKGHACVYMNRRKYELNAGDMFMIPKFTFHIYECDGQMSHYYICFFDQLIGGHNIFEYAEMNYKFEATMFDRCLMKRYLELNPDCHIVNPDPKSYDNKPELFKISREKKNANIKNDIECNGILLQLFSRFIAEGHTRPSKNNQSRRMTKVFNYINNNLGRNIKVADLAEIMCVSQDHFTRMFKLINGINPNQFVQLKRVERAQTLMISTDMSIKEIAEEIGIPNLSQFSKLFQKQMGMSPRDYIRICLKR